MAGSIHNSPPLSKGKPELPSGLSDIPIVHALYQTYASLHLYVLKFPKSQRYSLGQTIQDQLLAIMEVVVASAATPDPQTKLKYLRGASSKLDLLRMLIRLAKDCHCLDNKSYLQLESQLHEIGRMLGGWLKTLSK